MQIKFVTCRGKMKFFLVFVLIFVKFCDSNDFKCVYFNDTIKSVEFYCENFKGTLPENCTTTYLYSIGYYDKSKVTQLKIGGCHQDKIGQLVEDYKNIQTLDISCSELRSLKPVNIKLEHLQKLNISHNQLKQNPREFCLKLPQLMEVDFSHNNLHSVWGLSQSLIIINISNNNISYIGSHDLTSLPNLEHLDLSKNTIEKIDHDDIFSKAQNLILLQLEENRYKKFDGKFLLMIKRGVIIHFSWEYITDFEIKENIGKPFRIVLNNKMEGVWPSSDGNRIELHCSEGSFDNIRRLKFVNNHIENPNELIRCLSSSLEKLILIGNFTEKISSTSLEPLTNMWELIINGAQSMEFDFGSIKKPERLCTLDISRNNLKEIGNVSLLENFPLIFLLNVTGNELKNASEIIQHFRGSIARIHLNGNHVGKLNETAFENMDLYELYLKNTSLSFDDVRLFEPLMRLKQLDISYNNLASANFSVPSTALKMLSYFSAAHCNITNGSELINLLGSPLRILDLSGNNIGHQLNAIIFENFINLQTLNLSGTNLIEIQFDVFQHTHYFYEADFSNNKLKIVNITSAATHLGIVNLDGNEITDIQPFTAINFPKLWKLSISNNHISCTALAQLKRYWPTLEFINNPFEQKHSHCSNVVGLINNLGFVGTFISKWF